MVRGSQVGANLLAGCRNSWGLTQDQSLPGGIHGRGPQWNGLLITATYRKDLHWRCSWKTVSDTGLEKMCKESSSLQEEEGAEEIDCDEMTIAPFPHPPVLLSGRRYRNRE